MSKKELKFYIPLVSKYDGKNTRSTLLNANNIPEIHDLFPTLENINEHLQVERKRRSEMGQKYRFTPMLITVTQEKFDSLISTLNRKFTGKFYNRYSIELCLDSNSRSVIVIEPEKQEQNI